MSNPFDYVEAINSTKKDLMTGSANDVLAEKGYDPYITNKALSYFPETILVCNEMNKAYHLDKKLQFHFYLNMIKPKKRYSKWVKREKDGDVAVVKEYFGYSDQKVRQALSALSETDILSMREKLEKGGKK